MIALTLTLSALAGDLPDGVEVRVVEHRERTYRIVSLDLRKVDLDLYGQDPTHGFVRTPSALQAWLREQGRELIVATNAGMYRPNYRPVGLHVERGVQRQAISRGATGGNFGLQPNGVFWVDDKGAGVTTTEEYASAAPRLATQSGPMLVIDGALHPALEPESPNLLLRSGVGVSDPWTVHLVISQSVTRFHELATLFRDVLGCANALYLDGVVSQMIDPAHPPGPATDGRYSGILAVTVGAR